MRDGLAIWFSRNRNAKLDELAVIFRSIGVAFFVGAFLATVPIPVRMIILGLGFGAMTLALMAVHAKHETSDDPD